MIKKKINFKPASEVRATMDQKIDQWVTGGDDASLEEETIKENNDIIEQDDLYRLSLDIPKFLHKRIKKTCVVDGVSMKEKLTDLLLNAFPEK